MTAHAHNITADRATVRQFCEIYHQQAARAFEGVEDPGYLQIVLIHPASGAAVAQQFRIGDVEGMEAAALQASANGHNVYVEGRAVKRTTKGRGKFEDTRGVFALVTDSDADKGMASRVEVLPSLAVETSPGNAHHWFFLKRAVGADEGKALGDAIRAATGADSDTGVITQPYRVAGTPNYPGAKKQARGRIVTPTKILQHLGTRWTADDLRDVFPAKPKREAGSKGEKAAGSGSNPFTRARVEPDVMTRGEHRSRQFYKAVHAAIAAGMTPDELEELMREHPDGCASKFLEDGDRLREEIERAWPKAEQEQAEAAAEAEDDLARLNAKYWVIQDGGKTRVLSFAPRHEKGHKRLIPTFMTFEDFRNLHCNKKVKVGDKYVPLGHWWLTHPERRQYDGLTFQPGEREEIEGQLNLWRGWGVEPKPGDWSLMERHIKEVLAGGNAASADYIINWVAWSVQHPDERAQVVIAFKGPRGTGKGTLGNALCKIFGQHGTHISSADHLAGRFNGHLRDACLLFVDEAYWPGDKGAEGSLKRLVTEPDLFIEAKGRDGVTVPNMLHIIMASNEDWIVPAGESERRYAVFEVSDCHKQDEAWFKPLYAEMEAGGLGAMLYDLLRLDLGDWHPRRLPKTDALTEQQARSLSPEDEWWLGILESGTIPASDPGKPSHAVSGDYVTKTETYGGTRETKHHGLYHYARVTSPRLKGKSDAALGRHLAAPGCKRCRVLRQRGWEFPALSAARAAWEARFPGWPWESHELTDWQSDED